MPNVDLDKLMTVLSGATPTGTAARTWPGAVRFADRHHRAAEHMVSDVSPGTAATPHGVVPISQRPPTEWINALAARRADNLLARLPLLVEVGSVGNGMPVLPEFTAAPAAGPQGGEKTEAYSKAFTIGPALSPAVIDASLYLNISLQADALAAGLVDAVIRAAVVAEAEHQIATAIDNAATDTADIGAAFAAFDGMYRPSLVIGPPSAVITLAEYANSFAATGIAVALVPGLSRVLVLDPLAVTGWLLDIDLSAVEPSVLGRVTAAQIYGAVSAAAGGVAAITTTP